MKVYNNLTRELEDFVPIHPPVVNIYSCGPTVYDQSHIGHARSAIAWDILYRYLRHRGYEVNWIRNITNIDDKIVQRSKELGASPDKLSRVFTYEFWSDMVALNVSWPDHEPRATDYLPEMFAFIQDLIDKDYAYEVDGDVYFRVSQHSNYGQLKGLSLDELRDGEARVDANERKQDQLDFALWKAFTDKETSFESPWGWGRPGWHLECSTMIKSLLDAGDFGPSLDIHAGGDDLIFPHHENECAQSECLSGKPLAKYWMHNGMVMVNGAKMSKSEGNFFTVKDLLEEFKSNTIRYFCLSTHYKKQINFSREALEAAETGFEKLYQSIKPGLRNLDGAGHFAGLKIDGKDLDAGLVEQFNNAMDDDIGTPQALALLFDNKAADQTIIYLLDVLGFDLINHDRSQAVDDGRSSQALGSAINLLLQMRDKARELKDFKTSDEIRDKLSAAGVSIQDHKDKPSEWSL